jgi:RNA polymerase sigma-70 factor (ECF subfamily)
MPDVDPNFETHRPHLEQMAYRMLGSRTDADDVLQDAYLRWSRAPRDDVRNPRAFASSIVTRLCIDRRRQIDLRKETYIGPWLPEPVIEAEPPPGRTAEVAESVSLAMMHVLERLSPVERAAYLLRQIFGFEYAEIGQILEKSEVNCRQIVSRAEERVHAERPRFEPDREVVARISEQFLAACATGDYDGLLRLLADDVVMLSDGGGKVAAALRPVSGSDHVARFFLGIFRKAADNTRIERASVNGQPGIVAYFKDQLVSVLSFDIADGRIRGCYVVRNPAKLAGAGQGGTAGRIL